MKKANRTGAHTLLVITLLAGLGSPALAQNFTCGNLTVTTNMTLNSLSVVLGATAGAASYGVAMGFGANGTNNGVGIGVLAGGFYGGTALGAYTPATSNGVAVGACSVGTADAVAVGKYAWANGLGNIALGGNESSTNCAAVPTNWIDTVEIGRGTATLSGGLNYRGKGIVNSNGVVVASIITTNLVATYVAASGDLSMGSYTNMP